jgi:hypothetical protein
VNEGQSISALPLGSDLHLFCNCECVIDLYSKVSDGTLDLRMPEQELDGSQVACAAVDERLPLSGGVNAFRTGEGLARYQ